MFRIRPRTKASTRQILTAQKSCQRHASSLNNLTYSVTAGPQTPPLIASTLSNYFQQEILAKHSTRPALICRTEKPGAHGGRIGMNLGVERHLAWDFEEFDRHIEALARGLVDLGVKKGDRVGVVMGNNSAYAMLQWACASIGAILVTLNPAYRLPELINTLSLVGVSHLIVVPRIRSSEYVSMLSEALPSIRYSTPGEIQEPSLPKLKHLIVVDNGSDLKDFEKDIENTRSAIDFREILVWREHSSEEKELELERAMRELHHEDVINLQFTSGTTGAPKAVSVVSLYIYPIISELTSSGYLRLVLGNLAAWTHGACIVYPSQIFNPELIVDAVAQEQCTALHGVPTHFLGVLGELEKRREMGEILDLSRLRTGIAAGSPIPIDLMKQLISKMNLTELTNAYGMSDPVSFQTTTHDPLLKRVETVGKIHPHVKAKVVDHDDNIVPVGTPGELLVSGYLLQKGYWEDVDQTHNVMKEDEEGTLWMHTGDEAIMDEEGYLKIVGRIKDIIIRGGENLFPVQIENVLTAHPSIREAATVAVPDTRYGEVVGAWIALEDHHHHHQQETSSGSISMSREDVRKVVAEGMNPQNAPTWVWFVGEDGIPSELPKTASGKVQKHILRDWSKDLAKKGFGLVIPSNTTAK
ncbi:acyl-CoA synthetase [Abortiporus biennis]|nr:acyl-CoA synthetase [Abortiporus biennis]